jgi:hypothetical protein
MTSLETLLALDKVNTRFKGNLSVIADAASDKARRI